jgi:hypothetical protein
MTDITSKQIQKPHNKASLIITQENSGKTNPTKNFGAKFHKRKSNLEDKGQFSKTKDPLRPPTPPKYTHTPMKQNPRNPTTATESITQTSSQATKSIICENLHIRNPQNRKKDPGT